MKKRIFSLLLMVVLLVTAIPVMAVSAVESAEENTTDYYKWYVGAEYGPKPTDKNVVLAGNFTAFANEDNSEGAVYNLTGKGGTPWYNKVTGGSNLFLYSTKKWGPATDEKANGGGLNAGAATRANIVDSGAKGIRMEGGSWATKDANVLVETSFVYVGSEGADWSVAGDANTAPSATSAYENFRFGSLRGHLFPRFTGAADYKLIEVWRATSETTQLDEYGQNTNIRDICGGVNNFAPAGLTLYMQKTTATEADVDYITYSVSYNNGLKKANSNVSDTGVSYNGGDERLTADEDTTLRTTINGFAGRDFNTTFFVRTQCDVYTVRAYMGGVLTQAEKAYNHLIDLLGFYQVAIPADMTVSSLMAVAPEYMETAFVYGTAFDANKAALTSEVASATVFQMSDDVSATVFVGNDDANYAGIRFAAVLDASLFENFEVISQGILIAPKAYVDGANGVFTMEALEEYVAAAGGTHAYLKVEIEDFETIGDDEAYVMAGGFVNFSAATLANNPEFAAVAYVELEGGDVMYSGTVTVDVKAALTAYRDYLYGENAEDARVGVCDAVLAQFAVDEE